HWCLPWSRRGCSCCRWGADETPARRQAARGDNALPPVFHAGRDGARRALVAIPRVARDVVSIKEVLGVDLRAPALERGRDAAQVVTDFGVDQQMRGVVKGIARVAPAGADITQAGPQAQARQRGA